MSFINVKRATPMIEPGTSVVRVGLLGYGRVGQAVAALAEAERERLAVAGIELRCIDALVRDLDKPRGGPAVRLSSRAAAVLGSAIDVIVEVLGGLEPARTLVATALGAGVPVVSANKTLVAACGPDLCARARACGTTFAFDAAVLAGVPFLGSLSRRPLAAAARRIEGIVNGTSHFVTSAMARGAAFDVALRTAMDRGYAEPDSSADVSGRDAAEKLTILLHLAGRSSTRVHDLPCTGIDVLEPADFEGAWAIGGTLKPVAVAALDREMPGAWVGPAFVPGDHPFAKLDGVDNALRLTGGSGHTVTFAGPGAGPDVTAVTILDDVIESLSTRPLRSGTGHWAPGFQEGRALARPAAGPAQAGPSCGTAERTSLQQPPVGSWFLGLAGAREFSECDVVSILAARQVPAVRVVKTAGKIFARSARLPWAPIRDTIDELTRADIRTLALPVLES